MIAIDLLAAVELVERAAQRALDASDGGERDDAWVALDLAHRLAEVGVNVAESLLLLSW